MKWRYETSGIPESDFIRGNVPITKTEVRVLSVSKLRLMQTHNVLDIGCGTGSVSVEIANVLKKGTLYAIDKNPEAINLTIDNAQRFGLKNLKTILGVAPEDLPDMIFDRIFIGGGSCSVDEIFNYASTHLKPDGIMVANTILLNSAYDILKAMEQNKYKNIECIAVNIARSGEPHGYMMKALNPIMIVSGVK